MFVSMQYVMHLACECVQVRAPAHITLFNDMYTFLCPYRWHTVEQEAEHKLVNHCGSIQLTEKGSPFMVDTVQAAIKQGMK